MSSSATLHGALFIIGAAILWGTTGTSQALAPAGLDSTVIATLRLALGGGAMGILALARGGFSSAPPWPKRLTLAAAGCTALYQISFFAGVAKTGVAVGTVVGIGSAPIAGGLLGSLFLGERLSRGWYAATILAILGCTLLTLGGSEQMKVDGIGILLTVTAGVAYAAYTLFFKRILVSHPPNAVIAVVFLLGSLLLAPTLWRKSFLWATEVHGVAVILYVGLITAALSYWLFARGLTRIPVSTATTLTLAEPLTAALLGLLVLHESLSFSATIGILSIFSGITLLTIESALASRAGSKGVAVP